MVNWTKRCLSIRNHHNNTTNILVCDDENLKIFPIRTAAHIVHFSLPNKVEIFKQRFITCYGFYEDRLRRKLIHMQDDTSLQQPHCEIYFDDNYFEDYIHTYELLRDRTNCELPMHLTLSVQVSRFSKRKEKNQKYQYFYFFFSYIFFLNLQRLRFMIEESKMKPLCAELITTAKNCDMYCPYRHVINKPNETMLFENCLVNMEFLDVLAPNHFSVRVISHKRQKMHRSKPMPNDNEQWLQFEKQLTDFYTTHREKVHSIEIGEMCLIFCENQPKRCRVLSKSKGSISVYLIDTGRVRTYSPNHLYILDDNFQNFPSQAIEVFVLGYEPNDCNSKWLPEAKQCVIQMMKTIKYQNKTQNYLQADVIRAFERTLIVKDLKIMYKGRKHLRFKSIGDGLIKCRFAIETPIQLHESFQYDECSENDYSDQTAKNSRLSVSLDELTFTTQCVDLVVPTEVATANSNVFTPIEPTAPANSLVSLDNEIAPLTRTERVSCATTSDRNWNNSSEKSIDTPISTAPSLDEILACSQDEIERAEVLTPTICERDEIDGIKKSTDLECDWLIDLSENNNNELNFIPPSPFTHVRVINSIEDLF